MSIESFQSPEQNIPEENKDEQPSNKSGLAKNLRRFVTGAALAGGLLSSQGEKAEAQSIHIPGTDVRYSFVNPFKKHGPPPESAKVLTSEDRAKIDTVLQTYGVEWQSEGKTEDGKNVANYLVTDKKEGYSFLMPVMMEGDKKLSFDELLLELYNNILSPEAKAQLKRVLDNEKALEERGVLEPKRRP